MYFWIMITIRLITTPFTWCILCTHHRSASEIFFPRILFIGRYKYSLVLDFTKKNLWSIFPTFQSCVPISSVVEKIKQWNLNEIQRTFIYDSNTTSFIGYKCNSRYSFHRTCVLPYFCFIDHWFSFCNFLFFRSLFCLSLFDLWLQIVHLVSSNLP